MLTKDGPKVLEFNCRLGDPETQAIVARMDFDLAQVLSDVTEGKLQPEKLKWKPGTSVCVVLASGGYPGAYETGKPIQGIDAAEATGATVFHAGTQNGAHGIETAGGRVLGVTAGGADLPSAIEAAYRAVKQIHFDGMHYRTDIGRKGLERHGGRTAGT